MKDAIGDSNPGTKDEGTTKPDRDDLLEYGSATDYRSLVARLHYLAPDRADIAFSAEELARTMSKPTEGCWDKLKLLGRHLVTQPRMVVTGKWQDVPPTVKIYADADWAGCKATRKSTSGGCIVLGGHLLKS